MVPVHPSAQVAFTSYYRSVVAPDGWYGGLRQLSVDSMLVFQRAGTAPLTLTLHGPPVTLPRLVAVNAGWNWLGFPYLADHQANERPFEQQLPTLRRAGCLPAFHPSKLCKLSEWSNSPHSRTRANDMSKCCPAVSRFFVRWCATW